MEEEKRAMIFHQRRERERYTERAGGWGWVERSDDVWLWALGSIICDTSTWEGYSRPLEGPVYNTHRRKADYWTLASHRERERVIKSINTETFKSSVFRSMDPPKHSLPNTSQFNTWVWGFGRLVDLSWTPLTTYHSRKNCFINVFVQIFWRM